MPCGLVSWTASRRIAVTGPRALVVGSAVLEHAAIAAVCSRSAPDS